MSDTAGAAPAATGAASTEPASNELPQDVSNAVGNKQAAPAPKKLKIADYEFASEADAKSEIERGRQSGKLLTEAHKRLEEARREKQTLANAKKLAKTDFSKAISELGLSREEAVELASKWLYDTEILPKQMSPEQQKHRALEEELNKLKGEKAAETKKKEKEAFDLSVKQHITKLRQELEPILQNKKIPNTRVALKRVALMMKSYEEAGVSVPAERAVDMVMNDYQQEFGELLDGASPDQLEAFLGKERMQKLAKNISKWALGKLKVTPKATDESVQQVTKPGDRSKKITPAEFNKFIGGL